MRDDVHSSSVADLSLRRHDNAHLPPINDDDDRRIPASVHREQHFLLEISGLKFKIVFSSDFVKSHIATGLQCFPQVFFVLYYRKIMIMRVREAEKCAIKIT